jgi:hypothetical protein
LIDGDLLMSEVNIAFSAGIDSTALLMMALRRGFKVNLHMMNVSGIPETMMYEMYTMHRIVEEVKKMTFKGGSISTISYSMDAPFAARMKGGDRSENQVCNSITQQLATAFGMADIRRMNYDENPGTWIGWNRADASETSLIEWDHSEQDYHDLCTLVPSVIGRLGNADNLETPFRMPLWDMDKKDIYAMLPQVLKDLVLVNGKARVWPHENKAVYNAYPHKLKELAQQLDMEMPEHWDVTLTDIPAHIRIMCGFGLPSDVGLPDEAMNLVLELSKLYSWRYNVTFDTWERNSVSNFKNFVEQHIKMVGELSTWKWVAEAEKLNGEVVA